MRGVIDLALFKIAQPSYNLWFGNHREIAKTEMIMRYKIIALSMSAFVACFTKPALAETLTFKCSFRGLIPQEIVFVVNGEAKDVAIIGDFGTHKGFVVSYNEGFFYIIEPNAGASVATILYMKADDVPVGVRTTLGRLNESQYAGIPDELKLSSDKLLFMVATAKGRCPVQR
jgi:hypothetical protein